MYECRKKAVLKADFDQNRLVNEMVSTVYILDVTVLTDTEQSEVFMNYWKTRAVKCCPTCKYIGSDLKCKKGLMPIIDGREIFYLIGECSSYEGPLEIGE